MFANFGIGTREHVPFRRNRNVLSIYALAHILVGEPVATSPEYALAGRCDRWLSACR